MIEYEEVPIQGTVLNFYNLFSGTLLHYLQTIREKRLKLIFTSCYLLGMIGYEEVPIQGTVLNFYNLFSGNLLHYLQGFRLHTRYPIVARALGLAAAFFVSLISA